MKVKTMTPTIVMVVCQNEDFFHGIYGATVFQVSYLILIDPLGEWEMWDDPSGEFCQKIMGANPEALVYWKHRQCIHCRHKTGNL